MSQSIKNFAIFKTNKKQDNHPDYSISAKVQKDNVDEYKEIGAGYIKDGAKGKYISVSLSKPREFNGKQFAGYVIVDEERFNTFITISLSIPVSVAIVFNGTSYTPDISVC